MICHGFVGAGLSLSLSLSLCLSLSLSGGINACTRPPPLHPLPTRTLWDQPGSYDLAYLLKLLLHGLIQRFRH